MTRIAPADGGLHDELGLADRPVVDQGADEAVDRVAPVVLGHGEDLAAALRRGDDAVAAADGQRQRFLAEGVQTQIEEVGGDAVVRAGVGRAVGRLQAVRLPRHGRHVGEDGRPGAEEIVGLVGQVLAFCSFRSQTATRSTECSPARFSSASPARCRRPIPPQPTIANRTGSTHPSPNAPANGCSLIVHRMGLPRTGARPTPASCRTELGTMRAERAAVCAGYGFSA